MKKQRWCISIFFILLFTGSVFAQQIESVPITPQSQAPFTVTQPIQPQVSQPPSQPTQLTPFQQQGQPITPVPEVATPELVQPAIQQPIEVPSEFEQYISGKILTVSMDIKQFGYDLFMRPPSTFAPVEKVPVGPEYVLGPGDEVRITLWGKIEGQWNVVVDRDGNIAIPKLGIIGVTGLTFNELKEVLHREFSKYFTGFEMNVSMGALRTIRIYVVGNAKRPGAYTVSSLSTLINALFEAGGPSKIGTMRDIQLKRNSKTIVHFDMYDFLLKGDKTKDVRLMPEDVIFIPPVGSLVGIAGNVRNPAIYELKDETKLLELIHMAGGLTGIAFKGRVQVQRIEDRQSKIKFEADLIDIEKKAEKNFILREGDLVRIFPVVETKTTIILSGAVANPGEYGITQGVTKVSDVISQAGGLLYYASNQAELTRVKVTQSGPETKRFVIDLSMALKGDPRQNLPLEINDYIFVRMVPEWDLYKTVAIQGKVKFPGTYTVKKDEKLSSLIERAGGYTDKAYLKGAVFIRPSVRELQQKRLNESIDMLEQQLLSSSLLETQVALSPEEVSRSKIIQSQQRALIAKMRAAKAMGRLTIKLDSLDKFRGSYYDIELEEGDIIYIPETPASVTVMGSVYNQTAFVHRPDAIVSDYIEMAGGMTDEAESSDVFVLKVDGSALSRQQGSIFGLRWNPETKRLESGTFMSMNLDPGDTIIVPPKVERIAWLREIKDITQILYQIAVTAGVLIVVF